MLKQLEDEKFELLTKILSNAVPFVIGGESIAKYVPTSDFFKENERWVKVLIGIYGKSNIIERVKEFIKGFVFKNLGIGSNTNNMELEYAIEYLVSANAAIFVKWIRNGMWEDMEKIKNVIASSMTNGVIDTIMKVKYTDKL